MCVCIDLHADSVIAEKGEMSVAVYQWLEASLYQMFLVLCQWMNLHILSCRLQHDQQENQMTVIKHMDIIYFHV